MKKLLTLSALLLTAFAQAQSLPSLRIGLAEDPDVLDPTLARTFVGRVVFSALCDKLLDIDEKLAIQPQLAQSWQWSADSKALTMKLRPGVTFHDGSPLDSAVVKWHFERQLDPATKAFNRTLLESIKSGIAFIRNREGLDALIGRLRPSPRSRAECTKMRLHRAGGRSSGWRWGSNRAFVADVPSHA